MTRTFMALSLGLCASLLLACGQTLTVPGTPTAVVGCEALAISPLAVEVPRTGGTFHVSVTGSCSWTTTSEADWIVVTHGSGADLGTITFDIRPNTGAERQGRLMVGGHAVTVTQAALDCSSTVEPATVSLETSGGFFQVRVTAPEECAWTAESDASWIEARTTAGSGSREALFNAHDNRNRDAREGRVRVAGRTVRVVQAGVPAPPPTECSYSILPSFNVVPYQGGEMNVLVTTGPTCAWSASSPDEWISAASGPRVGTSSFVVAFDFNEGGDRTGRIDAGNASVTIVQEGYDFATFSSAREP